MCNIKEFVALLTQIILKEVIKPVTDNNEDNEEEQKDLNDNDDEDDNDNVEYQVDDDRLNMILNGNINEQSDAQRYLGIGIKLCVEFIGIKFDYKKIKISRKKSQHLLRFDSTMVAISSKLVDWGMNVGRRTDKN